MARLTFHTHDGQTLTVDQSVDAEPSLMEVATLLGVPGIDGDCGGTCACGTCHVIVDPAWAARVGPASAEEVSLLNNTPEREATSRLACQIRLSEAFDGLVVRLPEFQQ